MNTNSGRFKKGHISWIKGMHHSPESNQKNREKHLGKSSTKKGKKYEEIYGFQRATKIKQQIRKNSVSWNKGKHGIQIYDISDEKNPFYGKHHTVEIKQKMSEQRKGRFTREKSPHFGKHRSTAIKQRLSIVQKELWKSKDHAKKVLSISVPSGPELYLDFLLQNYFPDEWKFVGDGNCVINGLCPDFININGQKKIIEVFGERWHRGKNVAYNRTEEGRKKVFNEIGYDVLIIWDYELVDEIKVIEKINGFVGGTYNAICPVS
jgi:very-short-patch-repair endonuclease